MPAALEATTDQSVRILRLSDLADLLNSDPSKDGGAQKVTTALIEDVKGKLSGQAPSTVRTSLVTGLQKAKETLEKSGGSTDTAKVVHVVTDLRAMDWEQDGEALSQVIRQMSEAGIKVHLVDVSSPGRPTDKSKPLAYSDNVGIVELRPRTRVAAVDEPVDFEVRLKNFGNTHLKDVQVYFFLNGQGNIVQTLQFSDLPAGQERMLLTQITFKQVATKEDPLGRFNIVTAVVTNKGSDALAADDVRHAVIEVREKLSVLVIPGPDEDVTKMPQKSNDSFYLRRLFQDSFRGINWVTAKEDALDKHDLRQYSTIFLVNVPRLTQSQVNNLERYVREGGGVGVFLGPKVDPKAYNEMMYKGGAGLFPVPLPPEFKELTKAEKDKRAFSKRVLLREAAARTHPALAGIYTNERGDPTKDNDIERYFYFVNIDGQWQIPRLGRWREDKSVQELFCLPNERPMSQFEDAVKAMREAITSKYGEPKFEKYRDSVNKLLEEIRTTAASTDAPLTILARELDQLLADQVNDGTPEEALFREFWGQPEMAEAKKLAQSLRDDTKFGYPLYFAKRFENGRVVAMTTTVGEPWSDWPSGAGAAGWVAVMKEMQKYLAGGGSEENRSVGTPVSVPFEAGRYKPSVAGIFLTTDTSKDNRGQASLVRKPLPELPLDTKDGALRLNFSDSRPGVYMFTLTWQKRDSDPPSAPSEKPEYFATVLNIDAAREGALQRAKGSDLADQAKGAEVHSFDDTAWLDTLKQKQTDLSSGRWIYLVIMLILILEQAMAVRLSHHSRPEDLEAFAPSAAAAFAHGTAPPPVMAEAAVASAGAESTT